MATLHEDLRTFMIVSRLILLGMRNISEKVCRQDRNTHFIFNNIFSKNHAIYEIKWENIVTPDRSRMTIQHGTSVLHAR
jgi:hypothetical protein